jgi:hypothetical protein
MVRTLMVPSRFRGPAESVNGGYMCGRVARYLDGPATLTLHRPPPLETPMTVETDGPDRVRVWHGGALTAEAMSTVDGPALRIPGRVSMAEVQAARGHAGYFDEPVFPSCFVCGIRRPDGDGLRIFPGPVPGRGLWAAPWTPDASTADDRGNVHLEIVWAALDCPSGIAAGGATDIAEDSAIVLGRMTATLAAVPEVGDECQLIAWPVGRDGRKLTAGSALLSSDGQVLAVATAVWLTVPRAVREMVSEEAS